tara:strand:- start:212 stop:694 length:483 start_codon:yes stop_codon:yes gene_type:complete
MTTLLDTNVIAALLKNDHKFHDWAVRVFNERKLEGPTAIVDIVYCECSIVYDQSSDLDNILAGLGIDRIPASNRALHRSGQAYMVYKNANKGVHRKGVLPDFTIGGIAVDEQLPLMTSNPGDFTKYYPDIVLLQPTEEEMAAVGNEVSEEPRLYVADIAK